MTDTDINTVIVNTIINGNSFIYETNLHHPWISLINDNICTVKRYHTG